MRAIALAIVLLAVTYSDAHDEDRDNRKITRAVMVAVFLACLFYIAIGV